MPARRAAPYPRMGTSTTRAPRLSASCCDPSLLPLSATTTSPTTPRSAIARRALATQIPIVSTSSRHGSKTVSSTREPPALAAAGGVSTSTMGTRRAVATNGAVEARHTGLTFDAGDERQQV